MSTAGKLSDFCVEEILGGDAAAKTAVLLGRIKGTVGREERAIVLLERLPFATEMAEVTSLLRGLSEVLTVEQNDIYRWLQASSGSTRDLKATLIFPATETHIRKYTAQECSMIHETKEMYDGVVKPFIAGIPPSRIQWVRNILEGKAEADRVLHNDQDAKHGFVILPDSKWDQVSVKGMYLQVIVRDAGLCSIRDLRSDHLPLLQSIRQAVAKVLKERFDLPCSKARLFFHYHPSYYHLHIHVTHVENTSVGGAYVGKAHLLEDVEETLRLCPEYYEKATLSYTLGHGHALYEGMKG